MKRKVVYFILILLLLCATSCSIAEPSTLTPDIYIISDNYTPSLHAVTHEDSGIDEISVTGLSGLLADDQHVIDDEVISAIENANPLTLPAFSLSGDILVNGYDIDAGSVSVGFKTTGTGQGITVLNDNGTNYGCSITSKHLSTTPADGDMIFILDNFGYNSNDVIYLYARQIIYVYNSVNGTEKSRIYWHLSDNGALSTKMQLYQDGTLYIAGTYQTFDEHDDAKLLKEGIKYGRKDLLEQAGILKKKYKIDKEGNETTIQDGYMMSVQDFMKLLAGGVYQNRDKIDALELRVAELERRLAKLETK